ncbi:hypothetical protein L2E82_11239 [Cichorium intybus]|uniref:Uncharacterized protein n=1 Tax=Cichorium intybus TaxID=13427 RepID=A0ACB9GCT6_CICIN|nr:hypothetical protein L2E82_11239 [Cichorium intybus]
MGACFSKKTNTTDLNPKASPQSDLKSNSQQPENTRNDQQVFKKEIFVIKHRISHEIDRHEDEDDPSVLNPSSTAGDGQSRYSGGSRTRTSSCSKEEVDAILIQCGRLSRSNSAGSQNPNRRRRHSRSKRSFDFDLDTLKNEDGDDEKTENDEALDHHHHRHREEVRVSSPSRMRYHRSWSKERGTGSRRRISISPSRRSESPFRSSNNVMASGGSINRPVKMVPVPATDKSNNVSGEQPATNTVKRIHVKRNVSPARTNLQVYTDSPNKEQIDRMEDSPLRQRRKSLAEIDNNAARTAQSGHPKMAAMVPPRTRKLSRDLDMVTETVCDPSPPSYASLLLEDIHNFHQKNNNGGGATTAPPAFELPACVTKACTIMEAVADLNSSNFGGFREPNSGDPITREQKLSQLGGFQREVRDYPKKGIGRGSRTAYSIADGKMVALT